MFKKLNKTLAIIAVVAIMAISTMTAMVSAAAPSDAVAPMSVDDPWYLVVGSSPNPWYGVVRGLVSVTDNGITFRCTSYYNGGFSGFYAYGQIANPALRADYAQGAILDYVGDYATDSFRRGWYELNGNSGDVMYYVQGYGYTLGVGQYIYGIAR